MASLKQRAVDYRIDPFDLHLLGAVIEHGTITAAAEAVSLSLAAASARLKALEDVVGTQLLERSKAGAVPTEAGRSLARHARRVLVELEALHLEMASFGGGLRGTLRVACNTAAMSEVLPAKLGPFLLRQPDLDVDVQELPSDAVLDALHRGVADLGIVSDYVDTRGLVTRPWVDDPLVAVLPRRWPVGGKRSLRFGDLLDKPFVGLSRESGLSRLLAAQASRSGRVPRHRVRLGSFDAIGQVVAAGVGVAVMPDRAARRLGHAQLRCLPLVDAWANRKLLLCTTAHSGAMPGIQMLVATLLEP
ncbi:MAG: LysR substrate-binding domain-containing protein [Rhizobacter sp.]